MSASKVRATLFAAAPLAAFARLNTGVWPPGPGAMVGAVSRVAEAAGRGDDDVGAETGLPEAPQPTSTAPAAVKPVNFRTDLIIYEK
ncbi:hypothetical protein QFZ68_005535 [Streptomyces sp. V1I6]|nr:hypothetical protein [Streptomyces sp. V1I6]